MFGFMNKKANDLTAGEVILWSVVLGVVAYTPVLAVAEIYDHRYEIKATFNDLKDKVNSKINSLTKKEEERPKLTY